MLIDKNNIDQFIYNAEQTFTEIIVELTQPQLSPKQRLEAISTAKKKYISLINEMAKVKKQLADKDLISKIDQFVKKSHEEYTNAINYVTNEIAGIDDQAEYVDEVIDQAKSSTIIPPAILNGNTKEYLMSQPVQETKIAITPTTQTQQTIRPNPVTAITEESVLDFAVVNVSNGIDLEDGEAIPDGYNGEAIFVVNPFTKDCRIKVTRFINQDKLVEYIQEHYRACKEQPLIIKGYLGKPTYNITIGF